jgi:hypothetical protein
MHGINQNNAFIVADVANDLSAASAAENTDRLAVYDSQQHNLTTGPAQQQQQQCCQLCSLPAHKFLLHGVTGDVACRGRFQLAPAAAAAAAAAAAEASRSCCDTHRRSVIIW